MGTSDVATAAPYRLGPGEGEARWVLDELDTIKATAAAGTWVYLPRRIPHSLRIESPEARMLWLVPGGFESFFVELFPAATEGGRPSTEQPDVQRMAAAAARYGVTILGPQPNGQGG